MLYEVITFPVHRFDDVPRLHLVRGVRECFGDGHVITSYSIHYTKLYETDPAGTFGQDTVYAINPLLDAMKSTTVEVGTKQVISLGAGEPSAYLTYDVAAYWLRNNFV